MKLFNKTIDRQLFKQYPLGSDLSKQEVVVKIFNPSGAGSWYILNSDPNDPDYLWAIVDLGYGAEVGSVSRSDLETYRGRFGLGFERDLGFDPVNAEELYEGLRQGKFYANGGLITEEKLKEEEWFSPDMNLMYEYRNGRLGITLFYGKDRRYSVKRVINNASDLSIKELNSKVKGEISELKYQAKEMLENRFAQGGNLPRDRKFLNHSQEWEVEYSKGKNRHGYGFADGGEVSFIDYKDSEIMYEPNYNKYYANDVEFDSLQEAQDFIDSGKIDPNIRKAYSKGLFADGGKIAIGKKYGDWSITQYEPLKYDDLGGINGGMIKLVNQDTMEDLIIRNDNALRGNSWFISYKGVRIEDKNPKMVIEKLFQKMDKKYSDGGKTSEYKPYVFYFYDGENERTFSTLEKALEEAKEAGQNKVRDNLGGEYFLNFAHGGNIESFSDNQRMIMNQNVALEHHHEELEDILEDKIEVPAWVVAKMATATDSVSAITHYLDGEKQLKEDEKEEEYGEFDYSNLDDDDDNEIKNKTVVEPINVSAGTKAEMTKKFTDDAMGNLKGFLKGMEGIDLRDDYTFDYKNEQFEIEPIINSDENGVSNAVFTIFDGDGEEVGEVAYSRDGGKQKFTANSDFFGWNNAKFEDGGGVDDYLNKMQMGEGYRYDTIHLLKDLKEEVENFIKQGYNELVDDGKGKLYLLNKESEIGKSFEVSEKEEIQAIIENFSKQKDSFADGGYFDGTIPKVSTYMTNYAKGGEMNIKDLTNKEVYEEVKLKVGNSAWENNALNLLRNESLRNPNSKFNPTGDLDLLIKYLPNYSSYAKGGEIAKAEVFGLKRNIMGTTDIEMKISGMRKAQDFIVYPIGKDDAGSVITIQSETRIGKIDLTSGKGVMSQSHSNGAYFVHFQMDTLTPFTVSESDLENIKAQIFKTAGANVGTRGIVSDNSGASGIYARGGVTYFDDRNQHYLGRPSGSFEKEIYAKVKNRIDSDSFVGSFGWKIISNKKANIADGFLYKLDDFDQNLIKDLKLKQGEKVFRYVNRTTAIGGMMPFIKINIEKALLYFPISNENDDIIFETKGVVPMWINLIQGSFANGGSFEDFDGIGYAKTKAKQSIDWDKELREYAGEKEYSKLTPREKEEMISDLQRDWDRSHSYSKGGSFEKVKWQDVEIGDSARVKELNKLGLIMHSYGRKFNLKFGDGTEKTFDASDLEFFKLEKDQYEMDDNNNYAKGGTLKKYILKADIKTVTVKRNGKEVSYKGADVLNGANVLSKGGDISSKANYVPKRDVVEVELKDGSKVKPVNGYWVKKGAEPIGAEPTPTSSSNAQPKINTTQIRKDARGNWRAETNVDDFNGYDWRISTVKTYSGNLVSSAQGGKTESTGTRGVVMFKYTMYEDPYHTLEVSKPKRLTDKVVSEQHDKAMAKFKKYMETGMFKGGGKISNFDKLSAKVAKEYEGKAVKSKYQEEYGKYYSKEEAQEVGDKVAGKMKAMQTDSKAFGGLFGKTKEKLNEMTKSKPNLAKKQVTLKTGKIVHILSQSGDQLKVMNLGEIGSGAKPYSVNISDVDPSSYELGGDTDKKAFGGLFGKTKEKLNEMTKSTPNLAKKQVTLKSGDIVQVLSQNKEELKVMNLGEIGSGKKPHTINISEVDPTSYKLGGATAKRSNGGTETLKQANIMAKEIRKNGESWLDAKKRAFALLKK